MDSKRLPSPLVIEGLGAGDQIESMVLRLLCDQKNGCRVCRSCKKVQKNFHPDWISADGSIKTEDLREKLQQLRQKPFEAAIRVFTILDFDETSHFVQNALLKTLEEPLAHWVILLGVSSRFRLLQTIRSRCIFFKIKDSATDHDMSESETKLLNLAAEGNEFLFFESLDPLLKDRSASKKLVVKLLRHASAMQYPGFWKALAPTLDETLAEIQRNLNPKLVIHRAWTSAAYEESRHQRMRRV